MKLFKRKGVVDDAPRCPACGERVPEGAESCAMCGHAFETRPTEPDAPSSPDSRSPDLIGRNG